MQFNWWISHRFSGNKAYNMLPCLIKFVSQQCYLKYEIVLAGVARVIAQPLTLLPLISDVKTATNVFQNFLSSITTSKLFTNTNVSVVL